MRINRNKFNMVRLWFVLLALASGLAACQPSVTPVARPTPTLLSVQVTPALLRHRPAFNECTGKGDLGLLIEDLPAQALNPGGVDLALRWGGTGGHQGPAYELNREPLVVIVHPGNRQDELSIDILQRIYAGELDAWSSPGDQPVATPTADDLIHPWAYPAGDDVQQAFETVLLAGEAPTAQALAFAPGPDAMLEAVANDPAAIGIVPAGWLTGDVQPVAVDGIAPELLDQPVLALSGEEPAGLTLEWLLCVQDLIGKEENGN